MVPFPQAFNGGTLSTDGGLVFQGNKRGEFVAYDAATGERVWAQRLVGDAAAAPMTYELDGEQYVSVLSGWGNVSMNWVDFRRCRYACEPSKVPRLPAKTKLRPIALHDELLARCYLEKRRKLSAKLVQRQST